MAGFVRGVFCLAWFALALSSGAFAQASNSAEELRKWLDLIRMQGAVVHFDRLEGSADGNTARAFGVAIEAAPNAGQGAPTRIEIRAISVTQFDAAGGSIRFDRAHVDELKLTAGDAFLKASAVDLRDVALPQTLDITRDPRQPTASLVRFAYSLFVARAGGVVFSNVSWALAGDGPDATNTLASFAVETLESGSIGGIHARELAVTKDKGQGGYRIADIALEHVSPGVLIGIFDPQSYRTPALNRPWRPVIGHGSAGGLDTRSQGSHMALQQVEFGPVEARQFPFDPTPIFDLGIAAAPKLKEQPWLTAKLADAFAANLRVVKASVRDLVSDDGAEPPGRRTKADAIDLVELAPRGARSVSVRSLQVLVGDGGVRVGQIGVDNVDLSASTQFGAAAIPRFSHLALADMVLVRPGVNASLGKFRIDAADYVGKAPTHVDATLEGVSIPVADLPPSSLKANLIDLKLDRLELTATLATDWQEATEEFHITSAQISAAGIGEFSATAALVGVPRGAFEHPETLSDYVAGAQLASARLNFRDGGLTERVLGKFAEVNNISVGKVRSALTSAMPTLLGSITDAASRNRLIFAAISFLNDPKWVAVFTTTETPQPLTKALDFLRNSPQTLPGLLKLDATANRPS